MPLQEDNDPRHPPPCLTREAPTKPLAREKCRKEESSAPNQEGPCPWIDPQRRARHQDHGPKWRCRTTACGSGLERPCLEIHQVARVCLMDPGVVQRKPDPELPSGGEQIHSACEDGDRGIDDRPNTTSGARGGIHCPPSPAVAITLKIRMSPSGSHSILRASINQGSVSGAR